MKVLIITYYDGWTTKVEQQKVDVDTQITDIQLPCPLTDINSVIELYRPTQPEHKVWLPDDDQFFVEAN